MDLIPSGGWLLIKFILIVIGIVYVYLIFYNPQTAMNIASNVGRGLFAIFIGIFKALYAVLEFIVGLFRRR